MSDIRARISSAFSTAITAAIGPEGAGIDPQIRWSANASFGDLQANFAMGLGKRLRKPPRAVAQEVVDRLSLEDLASNVEIAGPGFVNVTLSDQTIEELLLKRHREFPSAGVKPERVVIDYSAPNVAKEMHVGHIRSTIIGDALARILTFLGHDVLRRNHLGDWGTQFGMLVEHVSSLGWTPGREHEIRDLNALYREAKSRFDADDGFASRSRLRVVALQSEEPETVALWRELVLESKQHFAEVYGMLDVLLTDEDYYGESYYNDMLAPVTEELLASGVAVESEGAICVFPPGFTGQDGKPAPLIVRKKDGGYGYDTTDLAAFRHRVRCLNAGRIIYVTDSRQKQHFAMLFEAAKMAGWLSDGIMAEHVPFGAILGEDGKPFKTRSGDTVRLKDLLEEAVERAYAIVNRKSSDLPEEEKRRIARAVGIGAVKYADLSNDRIKDYVFSWDRMLSFDGNTAPYLLNAYVRIRSIFRKAEDAGIAPSPDAVSTGTPEERALAIHLLKFDDTIEQVSTRLEPHWLCAYLYDLASSFHHFYEKHSVINAPDTSTARRRLAICSLVADTLQRGLNLLGIGTIERM
ncbi:MAG TPA: arginine--tRNA ligase [Acidobacteriota bacterium]|nr:arginine--tRNA ligase [Acidobacteriota bacterium]